MLKTLHGFSRAVLPFFEIVILSFVIGIALQSSATAIVVFLILFVTVYIWSALVRSIGWGVTTILILGHMIPGQNLFFQILVGVMVGGLRYMVIRFTR